MLKVLVTGACGRLGQAVLRAGAGRFAFVPVDISPRVTELGGFQCDVLDLQGLTNAARGCAAIIHCAAMHGGSKNIEPNHKFIQVNVLGTNTTYEAALAAGVPRVVNASSLTVLYGERWLGNGRAVVDEQSPPALEWIYPKTKHMAEELGRFYAQTTPLEVVHLRYAWIRTVGVGQIGANLLSRSVTDEDCATATLLACTTPGLKSEVFLIGPDSPVTQADIDLALVDPASAMERLYPGSVDAMAAAGFTFKAEDFWPVANIGKAKRVLGWKPTGTFEAFLSTIGWSPARITAAGANV
jgi:nucleoside-diphosphate-sugar epimerase